MLCRAEEQDEVTSQSRELACCRQFYISVKLMYSTCGVKVRSSSIMIPRILFALTFNKELLLMVTRMEGGGGNFFSSQKIISFVFEML